MTKLEEKKILFLERCKRMWHWLAEHPDKWKIDYVDPAGECLHYCWACQYEYERAGSAKLIGETGNDYFNNYRCAKYCILRGLWPQGCERGNSPFKTWKMPMGDGLPGRALAALTIATGCDKAIAAIKSNARIRKRR